MPDTKSFSVTNAIKLWVFPSLVTILATMIWRDVTELRNDVKSLLAQSNVDKTKIENLEKDVRMLEQRVFNGKITYNNPITDNINLVAYRDKYFKHEEIFDINKYLPKND